jgi:hypothetical protein
VPDSDVVVVGASHPQLSFPLHGGRFYPSRLLTDIWVKSVKALMQNASERNGLIAFTDREVQAEFSNSVGAYFGIVAQELRHGSPDVDRRVTENGAFTPLQEIRICEHFLILPSLASEFLPLLCLELVEAFSRSVRIEGAWGRLALSRVKELYFELSPANVETDASFVSSIEIE